MTTPATLEQGYRYLHESTLTAGGLDLATSGGTSAHPFFFDGFLEHPEQMAVALLALAKVARTRFYVPPGMLAKILAAADPVVTSDGASLRFESFSACNGVYARLDVLPSALDPKPRSAGTTNVDVNPPLREALAGVIGTDPLHLRVGEDVEVTTLSSSVVEKKVPLASRWVRGFAEVQVAASTMVPLLEVGATEARRFLRSLPSRSAGARASTSWVVPAGAGLRLTSRPAAGAVCLSGPDRLKVLEPALRFATKLRAYGPPVAAGSPAVPSVWVLELEDARLVVGLSPEVSRGFSGEGGVLEALSSGTAADDADLVSALLAYDPKIDVEQLQKDTGLTPERVRSALTHLGATGRVGYDTVEGAFFHRELPYSLTETLALNPRMTAAKELVNAGAVNVAGDLVRVASSEVDHTVRGEGLQASCTCPWWGKHRGTRGPCKHVLAADLIRRQDA